jgi:phenylalanyl-tRNA synthetase beta chain
VVDITNYILHAYGQPLHAFDQDKIETASIRVKKLPAGTSFITLDGIERKLNADDLMICDGHDRPMCIGGVFGGLHSGIQENTKNIFLEAAFFSASGIRRSSMRHGLRTDAATRFEKGTDPNGTIKALKIAASMIVQMAGGRLTSPVIDIYPEPIKPINLSISFPAVRKLIGQPLEDQRILTILEALEMNPRMVAKDIAEVQVPTNKSDVRREVDVIEEILRIHGYNQVPMPSKMELSFANSSESSKKQDFRQLLAQFLVHRGFYEMMGLSLIDSRLLEQSQKLDPAIVQIHNTSNIHLDVMRPDMLISGLLAVQYNQNRQQSDLKLFEFGQTYKKQTGDWPYQETEYLCLYLSGAIEPEHWQLKQARQGLFFLKGLLEGLMHLTGVKLVYRASESADFEYGFEGLIGDAAILRFGKLADSLTKRFDLRGELCYAEIELTRFWIESQKQKTQKIKIPSKFPTVRRDLAFVLDASIHWAEIESLIQSQSFKYLASFNLFDVFEHEERLGKGKKSLAVSFHFENPEATLSEADLDKTLANIQKLLEGRLGASLR